jgi:hypothetical protein
MLAAWEVLDAATATRKRLLGAGFAPIPTEGKKPSFSGWQNTVATDAEIDSWFRVYENAQNTGVLTKTTPAIDIDIFDNSVAEQIEALAWEMAGTKGMVRFGLAPKRALLFRTDKPFKKISTPLFTSPNGTKNNKVEILGDGQQVVVFGTHPDTGRPYSWHGGEPGFVARTDLPELTEAMAIDFIVKATAIMRAQGWTEERKPANGASHTAGNGAGTSGSEFDSIYSDRERKWAQAALHGCADDLASAEKGGRNNTLNAVAFRLGTMVARHWVSRDDVTHCLLQAATACRLVADDGEPATRATLESGLRKGLQLPHPDLTDEIRAPQEDQAVTSGFSFEYAKDFGEAIAPKWIVKNHIARGEITNWIGSPGSGKSAMLGDLAIHIVAGVDWRGSRLKEKCGVLYFALERHDLVKRRFKVQAKKWGLCLEDLPFAVCKEVINLMNPLCVEKIIATIKAVETGWEDIAVGMIVIDTANKAVAVGGGDENSARDANIMHANLRRIQVACNVAIALVGHVGKDESRGQRGSNAPRGDVDKEQMLKDGEVIRTKNNDGPEGPLFAYRMEAVVVGVDGDGDAISTAVIADEDPAPRRDSRRAKLNPTQRRAMELLDRALIEEGKPAPQSTEIPPGISIVVTRETWCTYCINGNISAGSAASSERAFRRVMIDLVNRHFIGTWKEWVWVAYD